ncbi:MAG TPA: hypothetical protein HPP77_08215 [Candidatus Hydrogenedentes bacterium]|nr:hypothetical protein [Candidatus Hydrogenedentota bacterium]
MNGTVSYWLLLIAALLSLASCHDVNEPALPAQSKAPAPNTDAPEPSTRREAPEKQGPDASEEPKERPVPARPRRANRLVVDNVVWEPYVLKNVLDPSANDNTVWMFPGQLAPYDPRPDLRDKSRVGAHLNTGEPGVTVYFKVWDADNPAASTPPIDDDSLAKGDDNRGPHWPTGITAAVTDDRGHACITVITSLQPGDNYKVSASPRREDLEDMTCDDVD